MRHSSPASLVRLRKRSSIAASISRPPRPPPMTRARGEVTAGLLHLHPHGSPPSSSPATFLHLRRRWPSPVSLAGGCPPYLRWLSLVFLVGCRPSSPSLVADLRLHRRQPSSSSSPVAVHRLPPRRPFTSRIGKRSTNRTLRAVPWGGTADLRVLSWQGRRCSPLFFSVCGRPPHA
ncbi:unnamed protein product [Urochloa humidicola]